MPQKIAAFSLIALSACQPSDPGEGGRPEPLAAGDAVPGCTTPPIRINEVQASNRDTIADADGDSPDWIELYNAGAAPVDLASWTITDDPDDPGRWVLPRRTLEPGEFLLLFASGKDRGGGVVAWDTRIDQGHSFRYQAVDGPAEVGWREPGFDDAAWATGPSGFGRGDDDDATVVSDATTAVRVRATFEIAPDELADLQTLLLHVDHDDGFVAWLDGVEVARANLGEPGTEPPWDGYASSTHEAELYQGGRPERFDLTASVPGLTAGAHVLALEVHDASPESTDLTLIPFLTLGFAGERAGAVASASLGLDEEELHTNFSLSADGEPVYLFDPRGCVADHASPDRTWLDQSHGRATDGRGPFGYFMEPTPGAPNVAEWRAGYAATPTLSPPAGFYPGGISVTVSAEPTSAVTVSFDGAEPTEAHEAYASPIALDGSAEAAVIRARAFEDGLWPSPIATETYFARDPGPLGIVSLVTDPVHLWDETTGIYVEGPDADPEPPHHGANYWQDWERPLHMAFFEPSGVVGFAQDGGVEIHGGYTRPNPQKSLRLIARSGYGPSTITHDVFPGLGIVEFDRLVLRAAGNDWLGCEETGCKYRTLLRDAFVHELVRSLDLDVLAYRPAEVYLNGEYWGIQNLRERPDASYVASHHGETDIDLIENRWGDDGSVDAYEALLAYLRTHDLSDPTVWAQVEAMIDVEELCNYLIVELWVDNRDWPGNNVRFWRPRRPDGRWRWILYDTDFGLGLYDRSVEGDTLAFALEPDGPSWPNPPWSTELLRLLMDSTQFRTAFVNRYADLMNTTLAPAESQALLADMAAEIAPVIPDHEARWGTWTDGATTHELSPGGWEDEVARVHDWIGERSLWTTEHVVTNLGLAGTWTLQLDADPPGSGTFALTSVVVDAPFTGTYFQGVPVTLTALPAPGYTFAGWSDPLLTDPTVVLDPSGPVGLTAHFE